MDQFNFLCRALDSVSDSPFPLDRVEISLSYAEWLVLNGCPIADAEDQLALCADWLMDGQCLRCRLCTHEAAVYLWLMSYSVLCMCVVYVCCVWAVEPDTAEEEDTRSGFGGTWKLSQRGKA